MSRQIRVAIFGAGSMGKQHGNCLQEIADVSIVGIGSRSLSSAQALSEELKLDGPCFDDFEDMIDSTKPDAVYINLIPSAHNGELEYAAEHGIHVFIEKPIAKDCDRASSMLAAADRAQIVTQVGYHFRFGAAVEHLQSLIANGKTGKACLYQGRYFCNCLHGDWWRQKEHAVAQIFEQIIHQYDMASYLFGEVQSASGHINNICHQDVENYSVEDTSIGNVIFKNGAMASIVGSNCAIPGQWIGDMRVVFEHVTVDFRSANDATFYYPNGEWDSTQEIITGDDNMYLKESQDFIDAIRENRPTRSPLVEGYKGVALCAAVLASAADNGSMQKPALLKQSQQAH